MKFGVSIPNMGLLKTGDDVFSFAREIEALGFESVWVSDHVVVPRDIASRYPYRSSGEFSVQPTDPVLEPLAVMAALAAATQRIRIGVSVLVIPYRNPVVTAKTLATIDVLSGGRVILGAGAGWMSEEFDVLKSPPFADRGPATDSYIRLFRELWTSPSPSFNDPFYTVSNVGFEPKPVQNPLPIWIGGITGPALRRAARLGDGWQGIRHRPPKIPAAIQRLHQLLEEEERSPEGFTMGMRTPISINQERAPEEAIPLEGTPQHVRDDVRRYEEAGIQHLVINPRGRTLEAQRDQVRLFAEDVVANL